MPATMRFPQKFHQAARAAALALISLSSFAAAAQDSRSAAAICAPYYEELLAKGRVTRTSDAGTASLLPLDPVCDGIKAAIELRKPGILVETAFFLPRRGTGDPAGRMAELARIYGLLRSFSTLEGIQYYSVTYAKMRTLYAESYRIDAPDTRLRLPDPVPPLPGEIPKEETLFAFQRDLSLGANVYRYVFAAGKDSVIAELSNLTRMSFGILPLIAPLGLKTRLVVMPSVEGIVFYTESDCASAGPFRSHLEESFANRAVALFSWFSSRYALADKP